ARREAALEKSERPKATNRRQKKSSRTGSQLDSTLTKPELTMAESVKALAERLIKEELIPKAEAHDALLASTGTKDGKKMAELQVKDSEKQHTEN
ncbi:hypothetical protein PSTG_20112, partial [Puccinia striiformis f. sp. tritici PST-78]